MASFPPTDAQRAAAMPWVIAALVSMGLSTLSLGAMCLYLWVSAQSDLRIVAVWLGATLVGGRLFSNFCHARLDRLAPRESDNRRDRAWSVVCSVLWFAMVAGFVTLLWTAPR